MWLYPVYLQRHMTSLPEQPEIVETEDFYWRVRLPDGAILESERATSGDRTKFNTVFGARVAALDWWLGKCADQWNPKVTRQA